MKWEATGIRDWHHMDAALPGILAVVYLILGLYYAGVGGGPTLPLLATWLWLFAALSVVWAASSHYGVVRPLRTGALAITLPVVLSVGIYVALVATVWVVAGWSAWLFAAVAVAGAVPALLLTSRSTTEGVSFDLLLGGWLSAVTIMVLVYYFDLSPLLGWGAVVSLSAGAYLAAIIVDTLRARAEANRNKTVFVVGYLGGLDALLVVMGATSILAVIGLCALAGG